MEIKINREIREYTEKVFFGLSLRQFIFSAIACIVAVVTYFLLKNYINLELLSWFCIMSAIPFAMLGFVKYNGMKAEEFIVTWIKSEILMPNILLFRPENIYEELLKNDDKKVRMEEDKSGKKRKSKNT